MLLEPPAGSPSVGKALTSVDQLEDVLLSACDACMLRTRPGPAGRRPVYWWNEAIADISCIPSIGRWLGRMVPLVPLTFHMSQAVTGHGCFQSYLYRRARVASPMCLQCRGGEDTVEHALFECYYWNALREI
ncbi:PREDICTED: uncharacterized protein LOC107162732 [Diuraphis noxia]|uniref:uncharacterized protein LOC107162732 n=1 Tax=Diuraphis noxia TaxID=143948 RepID=UPI000763556A|nr:PREDICTED: uncharacterized protein LOC107162732 [Diuraphis noxia]